MGIVRDWVDWGRGTRPQATVLPDVSRSIEDYISGFTYQGNTYPYGLSFTQPGKPAEEIEPSFAGYIRGIFRTSPIAFACMEARRSLFSEARFQWRELRSGRPGNLFGNQELEIVEKPWAGATTGDLLSRAIQDVDLAGNSYYARQGDKLRRMRPDWTTIVIGSRTDPDNPGWALDAEVAGYAYTPGGNRGQEPILLLAEQVAHFAPVPDPEARFRGVSWLSTLITELQADQAMSDHRLKFFEGGGTPNLAISLDVSDPDRFQKWVDKLKSRYQSGSDPYQWLYLGSGAQVTPVGADIQQLDFKAVQGAGETRIASAAGVPPVIVGFSEGLEAATYSNYALAMRRYADLTIRPLWRNFVGSLERILTVPASSELWYDDRDIPALKDDIVNRAEVQAKQAAAAKLYFDAGYDPASIVDALASDDITRLEHLGVSSVQTQGSLNGQPEQPALPPGEEEAEEVERSALRELETVLEEKGAT